MNWFNYMGLALPRPPAFVGLDVGINVPVSFVDSCTWNNHGMYWRTVNLAVKGRKRGKRQEQQRLDRWSNVRRDKRARELDRRDRKEGKRS